MPTFRIFRSLISFGLIIVFLSLSPSIFIFIFAVLSVSLHLSFFNFHFFSCITFLTFLSASLPPLLADYVFLFTLVLYPSALLTSLRIYVFPLCAVLLSCSLASLLLNVFEIFLVSLAFISI